MTVPFAVFISVGLIMFGLGGLIGLSMRDKDQEKYITNVCPSCKTILEYYYCPSCNWKEKKRPMDVSDKHDA